MKAGMGFALSFGLACLSGPVSAIDPTAVIVDEGKLGLTHQLAPGTQLAAPGYPASYSGKADDVCIALGYTVKPDGSTGDFKLLSAWTSDRAIAEKSDRYLDTFASAAAQAVSQWRFAPKGEGTPQPIATVATLTFRGSGATPGLADRCRVSDLAAFYQRQENGRLAVKRTVEQAQARETAAQIRYAEAHAQRVFGTR
ncbi:MAG TPA: hypothetical protein PKD02_00370 [Thermomonas sp.]|nr:hypothetical protein [Thermomonas sp.]